MSFRVHRVGSDDWASFRDLRLRALQQAPYAFASTFAREAAWPDQEWQDWARASSRADSLLIVAGVEDTHWVGMAFGMLGDDGVTNLYGVWVDPAVRGHGIGRRLVEALIEWARAAAQRVFRLEVADGNVEAIALYERMGFEWTGARRPLTSNPDVLEAEMLMHLAM